MTLPVPNLRASLVDKMGKLIQPWNSWFQQFSQDAPAVKDVTPTGTPFNYEPNEIGFMIVSGGTVSSIQLYRGATPILIATSTATPVLVPMSLGDIISVHYTVAPTMQFLGT